MTDVLQFGRCLPSGKLDGHAGEAGLDGVDALQPAGSVDRGHGRLPAAVGHRRAEGVEAGRSCGQCDSDRFVSIVSVHWMCQRIMSVRIVDDLFSAPPAFHRRLLPDSGERDGHDSKLPDQCECEASGLTINIPNTFRL